MPALPPSTSSGIDSSPSPGVNTVMTVPGSERVGT
jgi:hypothetical protein